MRLEESVPELEICQKMKEAGFPQDASVFVWIRDDDSNLFSIVERSRTDDILDLKGEVTVLCAAPVVEEVLNELPRIIRHDGEIYELDMGFWNNNEKSISWIDDKSIYLDSMQMQNSKQYPHLIDAVVDAFLWWKQFKLEQSKNSNIQ
jgi:SAM-dependent methyltransferase